MSVMLSLLSWFLLVMAAGGVLHTNSATAEVTIASNTAVVTAYWHTMLPSTHMPSAILELLAQPAGIIDHIGVQRTGKMKEAKYVGEPLLKARKMGLRSPKGKDQNLDGNWVWGSSVKAEEQSLDGSSTKGKDQNLDGNWPWGSSVTNDVHETNGNWAWGSSTKGKDPNLDGNWAWGSSTKGKDPNLDGNWAWGSSTKGKDPNLDGNWAWGSSTKSKDPNLDGNWAWGSSTKGKDPNLDGNWAWGSSTTNDVHESNGNWAWGSSTTNHVHESNGETNIGQDKHKHGIMSNRVFLEEALKPGSTIPCYIQPSANSGAPLLRREVADSIPITTGNFSDILTIFAPVSNDMATNIWSTLDFCEHPRAIKGETKACVTSVESMVDFNAFVLGVSTYNLQAFSSPDVPVQGVMTGRGYKVAAVTRIREAGDTITCHGMRFPFAMFMCHAVNPTRVYSVTLEEDDVDVDGMGQRMEVLVVCHLDTSDFHPAKMPLHVKPGDAPLCHFLSRDSILWTPAAPASGHAAA